MEDRSPRELPAFAETAIVAGMNPTDAIVMDTLKRVMSPTHAGLPTFGRTEPTLLERFIERAAEHHRSGIGPFKVRIAVTSEPTQACTLEIGDTLSVVADDAIPSASVTLTPETLQAALAKSGSFDARIPEFACGIRIEGNMLAAHYLLQLVKRPDPRALMRLRYARSHAPSSLERVPEYSKADARRVAESLTASTPLHLRGVLHWPALEWSLEELVGLHGHTVLRHDSVAGRPETLEAFIDRWRGAASTAGAPYSGGCPLPQQLAALFPFPIFPEDAYYPVTQLWAGVRRADTLVTPLHCDIAASFLAQVYGRKKVWLYTPAQHELLYPIDAFNTHQPCRVDPARPDFGRFARFKEAHAIEVTIEPGDLLIIPTGWYHCVWALDDVISVSRFMDDAWAAARRSTEPLIAPH